MATDPPYAARQPAPCPHDPQSHLVAQVHNRSRTVIDAELRRLARKVPSLRRADLDAIDATLEELAESLIVARLRNAPQDAVPLLRHIFDSEDGTGRSRGFSILYESTIGHDLAMTPRGEDDDNRDFP